MSFRAKVVHDHAFSGWFAYERGFFKALLLTRLVTYGQTPDEAYQRLAKKVTDREMRKSAGGPTTTYYDRNGKPRA